MREEILRAVSEIDEARDDIQRFGNLALRRFAHAQQSGTMSDDIWIRALGSYMHDFYTACERLFEIIADTSGEGVPAGAHWHSRLLAQMAREIPQVRPAVISKQTGADLGRILGFRHVFRHAYGHELNSERLTETYEHLARLQPTLIREIQDYRNHLMALANAPELTD